MSHLPSQEVALLGTEIFIAVFGRVPTVIACDAMQCTSLPFCVRVLGPRTERSVAVCHYLL
jgi:hypothetical protein